MTLFSVYGMFGCYGRPAIIPGFGVPRPDMRFASAGLEPVYDPIRLARSFDFWLSLSSVGGGF